MAVIVSALPACSSISKEVYTESRTLTYPKNGHPHIKEMYLRHHSPSNSHGANPMIPQAYPQGANEDWRYVPDIPVRTQPAHQQIEDENRLLLAKYYNNWLRE